MCDGRGNETQWIESAGKGKKMCRVSGDLLVPNARQSHRCKQVAAAAQRNVDVVYGPR